MKKMNTMIASNTQTAANKKTTNKHMTVIKSQILTEDLTVYEEKQTIMTQAYNINF